MDSVQRYLAAVKERMPIQAAYLFGSYATGCAREDSDIDLAVVSTALTGDWVADGHRLGVLTWGIDTRIEPVGYRPEDFNDDRMLAAEILRTGIRIL